MNTERLHSGPEYRMWPPISIGIPLLVGIALTVWLGQPGVLDPAWARPLGGVLLAIFALWNGWALVLMGRHETGLLPGQETRGIIEDGPFGLSRNPLYVGLVVAYLGVALLGPSMWAIALVPVAIAGLWWGAIRPEERYLEAKFGDEYAAYCARVRRWL